MSTEIRSDTFSLEAAETITRYQLLYKNSSGKWAAATATSALATHVATDNAESGDWLAAVCLNTRGSLKMIASAAITNGVPVYQTAAGKISSTPSGALVGRAQEAATADGDVIEVRIPTAAEVVALRPLLNLTANATLGEAQSGSVISNLGASGTITVSLPTGCAAGTHFYVVISAAQRIQVDPGENDGIFQNGAKNGDGKYMWADDEGESALFICDANNDWIALYTVGTWTVEP